jgi:hypothetical protein
VRDSAALLDATAGADGGAPYAAPHRARPYLDEVSADPGRLRIGFTSQPFFGQRVHNDCVEALRFSARLLRLAVISPRFTRFTRLDLGLFTKSSNLTTSTIRQRRVAPSPDCCDDPFDGLVQVIGDEVREKPTASQLPFGLRTVSGPDHHGRPHARIERAFDVRNAVPDHHGRCKINLMFPPRGLQQSRLGFAATAPVAGKVGADEDVENPASFGFYRGHHAAVDLLKGFKVHKSAAQCRLIGDHDDVEAVFGQPAQRLKAPRQEFEFLRSFDVLGRVPVDDAVAIRENHFASHAQRRLQV